MKRILAIFIVLSYVIAASAAVTVTVNGTNHTIPNTGEKGWGTNVTTWIQSISANTLQPSGGNFTLTADVDFGSNYGLKSLYFKSRGSNVSASGVLRLANSESIGWRNAGNSANLLLGVDSSNNLTFDGNIIGTAASGVFEDSGFIIEDDGDGSKELHFSLGSATASTKTTFNVSQTTNRTLTFPDATDTLVGRATSDTLTNKSIDGDDNALANIAISSLKTESGDANKVLLRDGDGDVVSALITDDNVDSSAAIALSKLAPVTASRALVSDGDGNVSAATTTATEIGYVNGVTSAIQTQLNGKVDEATLTTKGDIYVATAASTVARLAVGSDGTVLKANSSKTEGIEWASPSANLAVRAITSSDSLTTADDLILADASGGAVTLSLPSASGNEGKRFIIKRTETSNNQITIDGDDSETIGGATTFVLYQSGDTLVIVSDDSNWVIESFWFMPQTSGTSSATFNLNTSGYAAGEYMQLSGNSLSLGPGRWILNGGWRMASANTNDGFIVVWSLANGDNTSTQPTTISADWGLTGTQSNVSASGAWYQAAPTVQITLTATTTIYLNARINTLGGTSGNVLATLNATRVR